MGKKGTNKKPKDQNKKRKSNHNKRKKTVFWIVGAIAAVIVVLVISGNLSFNSAEAKKGKSFYVKGGETRPVLDPSLFYGMTRSAYAAAEKYSKVMDQVYCYCYCDEPPFYHKSLLSCFVDRHGAG